MGQTNLHPQDPKHLANAGPLESHPMVRSRRNSYGVGHCRFCSSASLRPSSMRRADIAKLFLFQLPMRCFRCGQRQFTSFLIAAIASRRVPSLRASRENPTWKSWTELGTKQTPLARPMSTVAKPRSRYIEQKRAGFPATDSKDDTV